MDASQDFIPPHTYEDIQVLTALQEDLEDGRLFRDDDAVENDAKKEQRIPINEKYISRGGIGSRSYKDVEFDDMLRLECHDEEDYDDGDLEDPGEGSRGFDSQRKDRLLEEFLYAFLTKVRGQNINDSMGFAEVENFLKVKLVEPTGSDTHVNSNDGLSLWLHDMMLENRAQVNAELAQKGIEAKRAEWLLTAFTSSTKDKDDADAIEEQREHGGSTTTVSSKEGASYLHMSYSQLLRLYEIKKEAYGYVKRHMDMGEDDKMDQIDYARRCARLDSLIKEKGQGIGDGSKKEGNTTEGGNESSSLGLKELIKQACDKEKEEQAQEKHEALMKSNCIYRWLYCLRPLWWEKGWIRRFFIKGFGCNSKVYMNGILLFLVGEGLSPDDVSDGINALALLNALLITIPFTMIAAITPDFLNTMKEAIEACPGGKTHTGASYYFAAKSLRRNCQCTIISALSALIFAIMYYLFKRNDNSSFRDWWPRGRILIAVTFLLTIITTVSTVALMNCFLYYFAVQGDEICDRYETTGDESAATLLVPTATLVTALYLMT